MRLLIILTALACMAQVKLTEDPPLTAAPKAGKILGSVTPANDVQEVFAIVRNDGKTYKAASFDDKTGEFVFRDLPGDTVYDIGAKLKDGRVIEGIDLSFVDARMLRLAEIRRKQLGLPAEEAHEFTKDDRDEILKYAHDLKQNDFMDQGRVLYLRGDGGRATMLVELMRNRDFYARTAGPDGAQIIWRLELWYFQYHHGGWERVANQERVLRRERIPYGQWQKISMEFLPAWSVAVDAQGKSPIVKLRVPDKPDPSTGRPAKTDPNLKAEPHVLGLPTSQPATKTADE